MNEREGGEYDKSDMVPIGEAAAELVEKLERGEPVEERPKVNSDELADQQREDDGVPDEVAERVLIEEDERLRRALEENRPLPDPDDPKTNKNLE